MLRAYYVVLALIAASTRAHAGSAVDDPPGTQTILLVKGGYGVGANLLTTSFRTAKVSSLPALTSPRTEATALLAATKTASALTQDLQDAVHSAVRTEKAQHGDLVQVLKLSNEVSDEQRSLLGMAKVMSQNAALHKQVAQLTHELQAEKALAEQRKQVQEALRAKVALQGKDLEVSSKAWMEAAESARGAKAPGSKRAASKKSKKVTEAQDDSEDDSASETEVDASADTTDASADVSTDAGSDSDDGQEDVEDVAADKDADATTAGAEDSEANDDDA